MIVNSDHVVVLTASRYYMNMQKQTSQRPFDLARNIKKGEEMFLHYGPEFFQESKYQLASTS